MRPSSYRKSDECANEVTSNDETRQLLQQESKSCHHSEEKTNNEAQKDDNIGQFLKQHMNKSFCADKESSLERLNAWGDGKLLASERRVLMTKWFAQT